MGRRINIDGETSRQVKQESFADLNFADKVIYRMAEKHSAAYHFILGLTIDRKDPVEMNLALRTGAAVYRAIEIQAEKEGITLPSDLESTLNLTRKDFNVTRGRVEDPELTNLIEDIKDGTGSNYGETLSEVVSGLYHMLAYNES
ncbi:MAG: hypothetical protein ABIH49_02095 [archaeon]